MLNGRLHAIHSQLDSQRKTPEFANVSTIIIYYHFIIISSFPFSKKLVKTSTQPTCTERMLSRRELKQIWSREAVLFSRLHPWGLEGCDERKSNKGPAKRDLNRRNEDLTKATKPVCGLKFLSISFDLFPSFPCASVRRALNSTAILQFLIDRKTRISGHSC